MSVYRGQKIVTDGLVLCLDAGNKQSYTGSGTVWYDVSGNNYNATISGTSAWSSSYGGMFDFGDIAQTTQYITLPYQALQRTDEDYSIEFWMKPVTSDGKYFCSISNGSDNNYYILQQSTDYVCRYSGIGSVPYSNNEIFQFTVVRFSGDTGRFYKNGAFVSNSTNLTKIKDGVEGGWILNQEQDSVGGGFDSNQNYRGAFMIVKLYNRSLNELEILQNYNALKYRYRLS